MINGTGGTINVKSYHDAAKNYCHNPNLELPFLCVDLTFTYVLLHDIFKLKDNNEITVSLILKK